MALCSDPLKRMCLRAVLSDGMCCDACWRDYAPTLGRPVVQSNERVCDEECQRTHRERGIPRSRGDGLDASGNPLDEDAARTRRYKEDES